MVGIPQYGDRFTFSRLFADCGHVIARAALPLAIGILVLGVAPVTAASLPWWTSSGHTAPDTFRRIWALVTTGKALVDVVGLSALVLFVTALSLRLLAGVTWPKMLQPRRLAFAFATALGVNLIGNAPSLATPLVLWLWPSDLLGGVLALADLLTALLVTVTAGVALPAALAEGVQPLPAIGRSFKLLAGLRWRVLSIGVAYLILGVASADLLALGLQALGVGYLGPGLGSALLRVPTLLLGAVAQIALVSVFLQARRIADGPSAVELHEVFA